MNKIMRKVISVVAFVFLSITLFAQVPVVISPVAKQQFSDVNGNPLTGGLLYTYSSGTSTPLSTYTDSTGTSQNTNPIVLDAGGWTPQGLFLSANSYKFVLKDVNGITQWTIDGINMASLLLNAVVKNPAGNVLQTISGPISLGTYGLTAGASIISSVGKIQYADTATCTAANDTCFSNAIAALPSTGGTIYACGSYSFTTSVTISKPVIIQGCGGPSVTTGGTQVGAKISPASGTPLQMFNVIGTGTSNMLSGVTFRDINFQGNYNAGQAAIRFNEVLNVITQNVSFGNWQQATDFDYFFRWSSINDTWTLCGAGNSNTTACNRIENRTNPGVPDEQVNFINPLMEGDQSTFTKNGIGWYFGSLVNQITFTGLVKCDYFNSGTTAPCMQFVDSNKIYISGIDASFGGAHPSTATATILVGGSGGNPTFDFQMRGGSMGFGASTYAVSFDYSQNTQVSGISFTGPGSSASALNYTANATGVQEASSNRLLTNDILATDASGNGLVGCNPAVGALGTTYCKKLGTTNIYDTGNLSRFSLVSGSSNIYNVAAAQSHAFQINAVTQFSVNAATVSFNQPLVSIVAGGVALGTTTNPFGSLIIGNAANNTAAFAGTFTSNRSITVPDASGTLSLTSASSASHAVCWKTATTQGFCSDVVSASGTCTCN